MNLAVALEFVSALVWLVIAERMWWYRHTRRPQSTLYRMVPLFAGALALHYLLNALGALIPVDLDAPPSRSSVLLYTASDLAVLAGLALLRHALTYLPLREEPPGWGWLAVNYGLALVVATLTFLPRVNPNLNAGEQWLASLFPMILYTLLVCVLFLRQLGRVARRGPWGAGAVNEIRRPDVVILTGAFVGYAAVLLVVALLGRRALFAAGFMIDVALGVLIAVPFAVRLLGEVIRGVLVNALTIAAAAAVYLGARAIPHLLPDAGLAPVMDLLAVVALALVLPELHDAARAGVERVVFHRTRQRRDDLQTFLRTLTPDLGRLECCRRSLAELVRVMQLRGAAVLFADGELVPHGAIAMDAIADEWPRGAANDAIQARGFGTAEIRELPLAVKQALIDADVMGVFRVASPRRHWGFIFMTTGLLGSFISDEDGRALGAFADQLALVLDGTELLERTVAVERSLAHAEKLAAIGELAARIAHEIRNPVTAARSLAQQLFRDPAATFTEEHGIILTELERVERQVAALLRFARREDFAFVSVDLGELVRATVESLRPRLQAADVEVATETPDGVVARADPEKVRQVLINLIENAVDAMADGTGERRLAITVGNGAGRVTLRVHDSGPGVAADALPHLFEPFFSLKPNGTGLGLAIARRTVEAHGGRITAESGDGTTFVVELPPA
jgi:signal transduction histidine kinase